jgi:hypothetical protein
MLDTLVRYTKYYCISLRAAFVNKFGHAVGETYAVKLEEIAHRFCVDKEKVIT